MKRKRKVEQSPDPMIVYFQHDGLAIPFEIPLTRKFKEAQAGVGSASLIFHGCTITTMKEDPVV